MPINLHSNSQKETQTKKSNWIEFLFFIALNLLVIPFSGYQTFVGYSQDIAGNEILALVVAAISAVLFAGINFSIRDSRLKNEKHITKIILYIIPLGMSFFGNFNAFYANQMKEVLLKKEIIAYKSQLNRTIDEADKAIRETIDLTSFTRDYSSLYEALNTEYHSAIPSGWGAKCDTYWRDLCTFLNNEGGSIAFSDRGKSASSWLHNANLFADKEYAIIKKSRKASISLPLDDIRNAKSVLKRTDSLISLPNPIYNSSMLDDLVDSEAIVRSVTSSFLTDEAEAVFSEAPLTPSDQSEIGTIKHTLNSAFVKNENPTATLFSFFISLVIDLAALLYILVLVPYSRGKKSTGRINSKPNRL